ncbi:hypothetical protein EVAR_18658_1 [Eumeta japonica]|uniref:Uncharacterized protein n=1 Tax=Eumeta variegata TaxID=151549 RepID=A0A4C1U7F1_EUMVA|nr:hypothetical protein EVAR_18658_1 [Eumeta japonica]
MKAEDNSSEILYAVALHSSWRRPSCVRASGWRALRRGFEQATLSELSGIRSYRRHSFVGSSITSATSRETT